jgi:(p)ppGpp synthase/HD superfamily hydrolase
METWASPLALTERRALTERDRNSPDHFLPVRERAVRSVQWFSCHQPWALLASLLHDSVEDRRARLEDVRNRFGERVARIIEACSDPSPTRGEGRFNEGAAG